MKMKTVANGWSSMTSLKLLNTRKVIKYVNDFKLEVNQVQEPKQAQKNLN